MPIHLLLLGLIQAKRTANETEASQKQTSLNAEGMFLGSSCSPLFTKQ